MKQVKLSQKVRQRERRIKKPDKWQKRERIESQFLKKELDQVKVRLKKRDKNKKEKKVR